MYGLGPTHGPTTLAKLLISIAKGFHWVTQRVEVDVSIGDALFMRLPLGAADTLEAWTPPARPASVGQGTRAEAGQPQAEDLDGVIERFLASRAAALDKGPLDICKLEKLQTTEPKVKQALAARVGSGKAPDTVYTVVYSSPMLDLARWELNFEGFAGVPGIPRVPSTPFSKFMPATSPVWLQLGAGPTHAATTPVSESAAEGQGVRTSGLAGFFSRRPPSDATGAGSPAARAGRGSQSNAALFSILFWPPGTERAPQDAPPEAQSGATPSESSGKEATWVRVAALPDRGDDDAASQQGSEDACRCTGSDAD